MSSGGPVRGGCAECGSRRWGGAGRKRLADRAEVPPAGLHGVAAAAQQGGTVAWLGRRRILGIEAGRGRVDSSQEILRRDPAERLDAGVLVLGELRHEAEAPLVERRCGVSDRCVGLGSRENGRDEHAFHAALGKRQRWTRGRRKWLTEK